MGRVALDGTAPITAESPLLSSLLDTENFIHSLFKKVKGHYLPTVALSIECPYTKKYWLSLQPQKE